MAGIAVEKRNGRNNFIKLKSLGRKWGEVTTFREEVFSRVGDRLFYICTKQDFLYAILMEIYPVNKGLKTTEESIERACAKVMSHFGFGRIKISILGKEKQRSIPEKEKSSADQFLNSILLIERLPYQEFSALNDYVKADLHKINELINWYESESCIKKFIATGDVPTNSEERMKFDFYQRSVRERGEIVKYQLYGLKKRVLAKVQPYSRLLGPLVLNGRYDRPYKFATAEAESYFDCRKIDLAKHRLGEFYLDEIIDMVALYESNKARFYQVYFKRIPWRRLFDDCYIHLDYLPASKDRLPIFKELFSLFRGKRWMAFYALGLPQVEGLFSEMCLTTSPDSDFTRQGLTKKVVSIRPHYFDYYDNLDYYQYHIPVQRNRFAHTGYEDDFQLRSYDLLVDLAHLLTVFSELNNPLVKVRRLHSKRNAQDFSSIEEFGEYFDLVERLTPAQRKSEAAKIVDFEMSFLVPSTDMISVAKVVAEKFPGDMEIFVETINNSFRHRGAAFDLSKTNQAQIQSFAKNETLRSLLISVFRYPNDELDKLMRSFYFMKGFVKVAKSGDNQLRADMENLYAKYSKRLKLIAWIRSYSDQFEDD